MVSDILGLEGETLQTIIEAAQLKQTCDRYRSQSESIAFVPTMGALHEGHLSLVRDAKNLADRVVVSIFVNPTQFGPNEDFAQYPRQLEEDMAKLEGAAVDVLFAPAAAAMYPEDFQTFVSNQEMSRGLCGAHRPGHFQGVLTIVAKLLNLVGPKVAVFGKKDYQQYQLIRKMVFDLNMPFEIVGGETVRESDGLALSSRNVRLTADERALAPQLYQGLSAAKELFDNRSERRPAALVEEFLSNVDRNAFQVEYAELRRQDNLELFAGLVDAPAVLAVAAHLGSVRLIDNIELGM